MQTWMPRSLRWSRASLGVVPPHETKLNIDESNGHETVSSRDVLLCLRPCLHKTRIPEREARLTLLVRDEVGWVDEDAGTELGNCTE